MTVTAAMTHCQSPTRDREVIRVDFANDKLGIAAALRKAFSTAAHDQCDRDLKQLLRNLN